MNLPNLITLLRLALIPVFLVLWWTHFYISATIVFFIASATDILDGHLARSRNQQTKLGALLDPLVDKILATTGLVILVEMNIIPGWAVVLMISREFLVTGLRLILIDQGIVLSAGVLGKFKTFLQFSGITFLYFALSLNQHNSQYYSIVNMLGTVLFWLSFIITIASGVQYAIKGRTLLHPQNIKISNSIQDKNNSAQDNIIIEKTTTK